MTRGWARVFHFHAHQILAGREICWNLDCGMREHPAASLCCATFDGLCLALTHLGAVAQQPGPHCKMRTSVDDLKRELGALPRRVAGRTRRRTKMILDSERPLEIDSERPFENNVRERQSFQFNCGTTTRSPAVPILPVISSRQAART